MSMFVAKCCGDVTLTCNKEIPWKPAITYRLPFKCIHISSTDLGDHSIASLTHDSKRNKTPLMYSNLDSKG